MSVEESMPVGVSALFGGHSRAATLPCRQRVSQLAVAHAVVEEASRLPYALPESEGQEHQLQRCVCSEMRLERHSRDMGFVFNDVLENPRHLFAHTTSRNLVDTFL